MAMRRLDKVLLATVRGRALAGGAGLATACDIVLAADDAEFGYPEVRLGLVPAMVGAMLRRTVGEKAAFELLARGERIGAVEARRLGLVTRVVPAAALTLIKRLFYGQDGLSVEDAIGRGAEVNALTWGTADARAGITRFLGR
jgi:methylglutaconyl-CoA hydratase